VPHDVALISTTAVGLAYALLGGLIAARLGLSPIVGHLLAGVAVGPFTRGFVGVAAADSARSSSINPSSSTASVFRKRLRCDSFIQPPRLNCTIYSYETPGLLRHQELR
jgi:Kef-type K+ transport system membrane component KefB